jgi:hypothetical protein
MRVDTDDYVGLTGRRPRGNGCWVFEIVAKNGRSQGHLQSRYWKYAEAVAEAKEVARRRVGRKGKVVLCP